MWEILGGLLVGAALSGLIPVVNAEVLVMGAALAAPTAGILLVAVVSAVGQMFTKTLLFGVARSAPQRLTGKARRLLAITSQRVTRRGSAAAGLVFVSAASGVPPFLGVSLAAGAVGMRTRAFVLSGGAGRLLRFGALAWIARNGGQRAMDALIAWGRLAGAGVQP